MIVHPPPKIAKPAHYPFNRLLPLADQLSQHERSRMAAVAIRDCEAAAKADLQRLDTLGKIEEERERAADSFLSMFALAIEYRPGDVAELFAKMLQLPEVQTSALVPVLESLLRPTVDWLRGEQCDLAERVTDLEQVTAESEATW